MVHPEARLHPSVSIGAYCVVGRASLDEECVVMPYTMIHDGARIGKRVIIHEHCSVGGPGFGFEQNEQGAWERLPQIGGVTLEDDVELFPYANVDRGTFTHTVIKRGTKVDHYAHIGHNTAVGEDCIVTAGVVTCGSTRVGDGVWMGVGSIVHQGVQVGSRSVVGLGAVLLKNVEEGDVVAGVPAKSLRSKPDGTGW
jgi:UDP-3-O-[3-hydroxymyristoyl] glucosamine N-acyltransferase